MEVRQNNSFIKGTHFCLAILPLPQVFEASDTKKVVKYEIGTENEQIIRKWRPAELFTTSSFKLSKAKTLKILKNFAKNDELRPLFLRAILPFAYAVRTCHPQHRLRLALILIFYVNTAKFFVFLRVARLLEGREKESIPKKTNAQNSSF